MKYIYIIDNAISIIYQTIQMSSKQCSFFSNKNIPGPHGHSIRDFTKKNKPITCPQLLSISCGYCHEKGHTVKYCDILKNKKLSDYNNNSKCFVVEESRPNKRNIEIDNDGFIHKPQKQTTYIKNTPKKQQINSFTGYFAALDMDNSDDNSDNMEENESKSDLDNNNSSLWTKIVSENKSNKRLWSDHDNKDDIYYGDN